MAQILQNFAERRKAHASALMAKTASSRNWMDGSNAARVLRDVPAAAVERCPAGLMESIRDAHRKRAWPIYLTGPTGTGKSSAAACCFRRAIATDCEAASNDNQWPRYITWPVFCSRLITARVDGITIQNEDGRTYQADEAAWWRRWSTKRLVVIDEIGLRTANEVRHEAMWQLLEHRRGLPTIVTGNLDAEGLTNTFDDRVLSRLLAGTWIRVGGVDQRLIGVENRHIEIVAGQPGEGTS